MRHGPAVLAVVLSVFSRGWCIRRSHTRACGSGLWEQVVIILILYFHVFVYWNTLSVVNAGMYSRAYFHKDIDARENTSYNLSESTSCIQNAAVSVCPQEALCCLNSQARVGLFVHDLLLTKSCCTSWNIEEAELEYCAAW